MLGPGAPRGGGAGEPAVDAVFVRGTAGPPLGFGERGGHGPIIAGYIRAVRIARFVHAGGMSFGTVEGESGASPDAVTVAEIDGHPFGPVRFTGQRWALPDVRLLSSILPSKVVCVGRNYVEHAAEHGAEVPKEPLLFLKPSTSVIGPHDVIRLPVQSRRVGPQGRLA